MTVFIIIGIIILIGASFVSYIVLQKAEEGAPLEKVIKFEYSGQEEMYHYIMACLKPAVLEGLEIMRLQGGYIYVPDDVEHVVVKDDRNRVVKLDDFGSPKVVDDEAAEGNRVPYWLGDGYLDIPSKQFLEKELGFYVEYETYKCIADFENFRQKGYEIGLGALDVDINLDNAVIVNMNFPLKIKTGDIMFGLEDFNYIVPVDWDKILNAGTDIVLYEIVNTYLEDFTNQMISVYSGPDEEMLPPFAATIPGITCKHITWNVDDVHAKLMAIIYKNMPNIRVDKTNYAKLESENLAAKNFYDSLIYDMLDEDMSLHISHEYRPVWGMDFDIKPKAGNTLRGDMMRVQGMMFIPSFCSAKYSFKYFVQYPSMVSIMHDDSADIDPFTNSFARNEGYEFAFPMKTVIYGNQKREYVPRSPLIEQAESEAAELMKVMNISAPPLFCEPEQRLSQNITIAAKDAFTGDAIEGAEIFYNEPFSTSPCFIDVTDKDGRSKAQYPICHNCQIKLVREGYGEKTAFVSTGKNEKSAYSFLLEPLKELDLIVKQVYLPDFMKYHYETDGFTKDRLCTGEEADDLLLRTFRDIEPDEMVVMTSNELPDGVIIYPLQDTAKLYSRSYTLDVFVWGNATIEPSRYDTGDGGHINMSLHPTGKGTYKGKYPLGNSKYDINLQNVSAKSEITFFAPVNILPSELIDVKRATTPITSANNTFEYKYLLDHDCNISTPTVERTIKLSQTEFEPFLQPVMK